MNDNLAQTLNTQLMFFTQQLRIQNQNLKEQNELLTRLVRALEDSEKQLDSRGNTPSLPGSAARGPVQRK